MVTRGAGDTGPAGNNPLNDTSLRCGVAGNNDSARFAALFWEFQRELDCCNTLSSARPEPELCRDSRISAAIVPARA